MEKGMKKLILSGLVCLMAVIGTGWAPAGAQESKLDSMAVSLRAEMGYTYYALDSDVDVSGDGDEAVCQSIMDVTVGSTVFYDRFAFDVYARLPVVDIDNEMEGNFIQEAEIDRFELGSALSYQLTEQMGCFLGLRYGSSDVDSVNSPGTFVAQDESWSFTTYGPTAGMNYGWVINKHVFNLQGGLGYMYGDYEHDGGYGEDSIDASVNSLGYVAGLQYRYLINNQWDFRVTGDAYYFDFGDFSYGNGDKGELEESTASVRLGFTYTF